MSQMMTGKQALLEMLKAEGVDYIFGNPGTSEGPIIDLLGDYPEFRYILTLQESVAVGMGEAYARAIGKASFVSLHVDSGLANGIALMLDALNTGTPMVVTSANYDIRKTNESITDLANLVRPVTKWAVELSHADQIPSAIRRAFNEANSHPKGPVYVGFTSNALEGMAEMNIEPSRPVYDAPRPSEEGIARAASMLLDSSRPLMLVGDRLSDDDALDEAVELAELMGLPVYQARGAEVAFPTSHPQYQGPLSLRVAAQRAVLQQADLVLAVGSDPFEELFYWGDVILPSESTLVHIDPDRSKIGRSEPTDVGIVADCKLGLRELIAALNERLSPGDAAELEQRKQAAVAEARDRREAYEASVAEKWDHKPMTPARMMRELSAALPDNAMVVDDSISNRAAMRHYFQAKRRGRPARCAGPVHRRRHGRNDGHPVRQPRPARIRHHRRRQRHDDHSGPLDGGQRQHPLHLRHLQQRDVPRPQDQLQRLPRGNPEAAGNLRRPAPLLGVRHPLRHGRHRQKHGSQRRAHHRAGANQARRRPRRSLRQARPAGRGD